MTWAKETQINSWHIIWKHIISNEQLNGTNLQILGYRAEMLVVNCTQSLISVNGLAPVMSSHCAGAMPPATAVVQTDTNCWITAVTFSHHHHHLTFINLPCPATTLLVVFGQVGLTAHGLKSRLVFARAVPLNTLEVISKMILSVVWPNQQCHSTERRRLANQANPNRPIPTG